MPNQTLVSFRFDLKFGELTKSESHGEDNDDHYNDQDSDQSGSWFIAELSASGRCQMKAISAVLNFKVI